MTVLAGRSGSFNAAHQLRDPALSDEQNRRLVPWLKDRVPSTENLARAFRERLRPELRRRYTAADLGLPDDQHY